MSGDDTKTITIELTAVEWARLRERYESGDAPSTVAQYTPAFRTAIVDALHADGVAIRRRGGARRARRILTDAQLDEVERLRKRRVPTYEIAAEFELSWPLIRRQVNERASGAGGAS